MPICRIERILHPLVERIIKLLLRCYTVNTLVCLIWC